MGPLVLEMLEDAFRSVGELMKGEHLPLTFLRHLVLVDPFPDGLFAAWRDEHDPRKVWIGTYHRHGASRTLPLHSFKRFLHIVQHADGVNEIHIESHQSPNPAATGKILRRLGFGEVAPQHFAALAAGRDERLWV